MGNFPENTNKLEALISFAYEILFNNNNNKKIADILNMFQLFISYQDEQLEILIMTFSLITF